MAEEHEFQDLFETPELIPAEVNAVLDSATENDYAECERIQKEVEQLGYTFDFDLHAEPYNLTKIGSFDNIKDIASEQFDATLTDQDCERISRVFKYPLTSDDVKAAIETYLILLNTEQTG